MDPAVTSQFIVVTGLSGAGRSAAADHLEDLGWFVIDNLPPSLIPKVAELSDDPGSHIAKVALVVGGGPYAAEVLPALASLRHLSTGVRIVFLEAPTDVLVRRFESTKRRHPQDDNRGLEAAIEQERVLLEPVKAEADLVIDTGDLNVHQLKARLVSLFGHDSPVAGMQVTVSSFGYKHGLPLDADLVVDCRFLPNPYWEDELRPLTGLDDPVKGYVLRQEMAAPFLERLEHLLELLLPAYGTEGKAYLSLAVGCTGGRHRSVVVAEELAKWLRRQGFEPSVHHRDVMK